MAHKQLHVQMASFNVHFTNNPITYETNVQELFCHFIIFCFLLSLHIIALQ